MAAPEAEPRVSRTDKQAAAMNELFIAQLSPDLRESVAHSLRVIDSFSGASDLAEIMEIFADAIAAPVADPVRSMTAEQEQALRDAGSLVEELPPVMERASTKTALVYVDIVRTSLTSKEAGQLLGVSEGRIRQRIGDRTLFAMRGRRRRLLPRFQFTDDGELPGWAHVAPHVPEDAYPVAVVRFMTWAHPDLHMGGKSMSPVEWLTAGGSPSELADLVDDVFAPVGM